MCRRHGSAKHIRSRLLELIDLLLDILELRDGFFGFGLRFLLLFSGLIVKVSSIDDRCR